MLKKLRIRTTLSEAAQAVGAFTIAYGVCLAFGLAVSLIVTGIGLVTIGTFAEMKGGK